MSEGRSDQQPHGDGHDHIREDDDRPRRGPVVCMALLVPAVGAAGGAAGPLFRGATSLGGPLLFVSAAVAFLVCFAALSLGAVWTLDKLSRAVAHMRRGRHGDERHGDAPGHRRATRAAPQEPPSEDPWGGGAASGL